MLPGFVRRAEQGLQIDLAALDSADDFRKLVERVFGGGLLFRSLDYAHFHKLLYDTEAIEQTRRQLEQAGKKPELFLAADIAPFAEARRPLYRGFKLDEQGKSAEYFFEPLIIDVAVEEAGSGEAEVGGGTLAGSRQREIAQAAQLDFDEFIAAAWDKGLRFGLDAAAIKANILKNKPERVTIARMLPPSPGTDASVAEKTDALHRSDAPKILPGGRIDLSTFSNRFPQVKAGTRLMMKVRRVLGKAGRDVAGQIIEPELPEDFDIATLAGAGTRIDSSVDGDYIVAVMDGFLNLDTETQQLSVTEKIINKEGVSLRTTGNVSFKCDEYEEHGEVQEQREVKGRHMTFMNNVFGHILSDGGRIVIKSNLSGGSAKSPGGSVAIEGNTSRSLIEAKDGEIELNYVDSSVIIGRSVRIKHAVACDIYADEVYIDLAEGCAIAAKQVQIDMSRARRGVENLVNILVPNAALFEQQMAELNQAKSDAATLIKNKNLETQTLASQPALKTFLNVQQKLKSGEISLTPEQKADFQRLQAKVMQPLQQLQIARQQMLAGRNQLEELDRQIEQLRQTHQAMISGIGCTLSAVDGETLVRTISLQTDEPSIGELPAAQLRARLREAGVGERLFANDVGSLDWRFANPT
jgi:hypothetical protein